MAQIAENKTEIGKMSICKPNKRKKEEKKIQQKHVVKYC